MLRLSKKADYGLMAMKHLALRGDRGSSSAREIAEQYDIPIELMAKVLQRLVRTGLLVSTQGTRGGYTLSRPSALISVADVVEAIDGPFTVTACSSDKHDCDQYGKCSVRGPRNPPVMESVPLTSVASTASTASAASIARAMSSIGRARAATSTSKPSSRIPRLPSARRAHFAVR